MTDEKQYLAQVERTAEQLRARCLGQDRPLADILPPHVKEKPAKDQAQYLAAQLQFALVRADGRHVDADLQRRCRRWLEGMIRFLLEEAAEEDRTFARLIQLIGLSGAVRSIMLQDFPDIDSELRSEDPPQLLREQLDLAIWWLLGAQGKQKQSSRFLAFLLSTISLPNPY